MLALSLSHIFFVLLIVFYFFNGKFLAQLLILCVSLRAFGLPLKQSIRKYQQ